MASRWGSHSNILLLHFLVFYLRKIPLIYFSELHPKPSLSLQFEYPGGTDVVQMRFLRLNSRISTQTITYSCQPGHTQSHHEREVKFLADTRRQSYLGALRDCVVSISMWEICLWIQIYPKTKVETKNNKTFVFWLCTYSRHPPQDTISSMVRLEGGVLALVKAAVTFNLVLFQC